jgi:hypothetical protein
MARGSGLSGSAGADAVGPLTPAGVMQQPLGLQVPDLRECT